MRFLEDNIQVSEEVMFEYEEYHLHPTSDFSPPTTTSLPNLEEYWSAVSKKKVIIKLI